MKKLLAFVLTLCMLVGVVPITAAAAETVYIDELDIILDEEDFPRATPWDSTYRDIEVFEAAIYAAIEAAIGEELPDDALTIRAEWLGRDDNGTIWFDNEHQYIDITEDNYHFAPGMYYLDLYICLPDGYEFDDPQLTVNGKEMEIYADYMAELYIYLPWTACPYHGTSYEYRADETHHWAICSHCQEPLAFEKAEHEFNPDGYCTCGYNSQLTEIDTYAFTLSPVGKKGERFSLASDALSRGEEAQTYLYTQLNANRPTGLQPVLSSADYANLNNNITIPGDASWMCMIDGLIPMSEPDFQVQFDNEEACAGDIYGAGYYLAVTLYADMGYCFSDDLNHYTLNGKPADRVIFDPISLYQELDLEIGDAELSYFGRVIVLWRWDSLLISGVDLTTNIQKAAPGVSPVIDFEEVIALDDAMEQYGMSLEDFLYWAVKAEDGDDGFRNTGYDRVANINGKLLTIGSDELYEFEAGVDYYLLFWPHEEDGFELDPNFALSNFKLNGQSAELVSDVDDIILVWKWTAQHTHTYDRYVYEDETGHWTVCTNAHRVEDCTAPVTPKAPHAYEGGVCVCGHVEPKPVEESRFNFFPIIFRLSFDTNGGSEIATQLRMLSNQVDLSRYTPTREGFVFAGWFADEALTEPVETFRMRGNRTVYAAWEEIVVEEAEAEAEVEPAE